MRITGHHLLERTAAQISAAQSDVARLTDELSSGVAVQRASDDPVAWAQARREEVRLAISRGRGDGIGFADDQLVESELALTTIGDIVSQSRALAIQGANAGLGTRDRAALGQQVAGLYAAALGAANTQNAAGEYVLAGGQGTTAPFDAAGAYLGDGYRREIELGEGSTSSATIAGAALTTAGGAVDVLPALGRLATALSTDNLPAIQVAIDELDAANEQVSRARADLGAMLAVMRDADQVRAQLEDHLADRAAQLVDSDLVSAATELTQRTQALEAAQAVTGRLATLLSPRR